MDTPTSNATGFVENLKDDRGFGFIVFTTTSGRRLRIFFHYRDSDGSAFQVGDQVSFDIGSDAQGRTRAFGVKFIGKAVIS